MLGSYFGYPNLYKSRVLCPCADLRVPDHGDPHLLPCCRYLPWRSKGLNTDSWSPPWGERHDHPTNSEDLSSRSIYSAGCAGFLFKINQHDQHSLRRVQACALLGVLTIEKTSPPVPISARRIMESNYSSAICNMRVHVWCGVQSP
jgi:hypothetical protein